MKLTSEESPAVRACIVLVVLALSSLALNGCASLSQAPAVGAKQSVTLTGDEPLTLEATVTSVEPASPSDLDSLKLDAKDAGTAHFFVKYTLAATHGTVPNDSFPFSVNHWAATDSKDNSAKAVFIASFFQEFKPCPQIGSDAINRLQAGKTVQGCAIFFSDSPKLKTVSFYSLEWAVPQR
jgi:hypothetical protein